MPHTLKAVALRFFIAFLLFSTASLFSRVELHFFVPPIVMLLTLGTLTQTAWACLLIGCFLDVTSYSPRFGFLALAYLLTVFSMNSCKRLLARDSFITLPFLTYCFSAITSLYEIILALLFDIPLPSHEFRWVLNDVLLMPLLDAAYSIIIFSLPHYLFSRYDVARKRRR